MSKDRKNGTCGLENFLSIIGVLILLWLVAAEYLGVVDDGAVSADTPREYYGEIEFDDYRIRVHIPDNHKVNNEYYIDYIENGELHSIEVAEIDINYNSNKNTLEVYESKVTPSPLLDGEERCIILNTTKDKNLFELKDVEAILIELD